jgi:glucose-1-phosphate adenylyltransferase
MKNVTCFILGGGRGTRLYPLTKLRAKPAVPLAGRYRLVDITLSNCINSGIQRIFVLTQFNSASLNRHIFRTYQFSPFIEGFVEILAAQQTPENANWFQGTADAVRQYMNVIKSVKGGECLVLSGDHLYRMDYRPFVDLHRETKADITISVVPVPESRASDYGLIKIDQKGRVIEFIEKPKGEQLKNMQVDTSVLGLDLQKAAKYPYIASMGIYVFNRDVLIDLLNRNMEEADFGKEIIPASIHDVNVQAYLFNGYWEDIGTIDSFYHANMQLVKHPKPSFSFYDTNAPIFSRPRFLPPSKIINSSIKDSMVCEGCVIEKADIEHSIIGIRTHIGSNVEIKDTLVMGADFYQTEEEIGADHKAKRPSVGIGDNTIIRKAIIDKNAQIGKNVKIVNVDQVREKRCEDQGYWIQDGIVIVIKHAVIPDGMVI